MKFLVLFLSRMGALLIVFTETMQAHAQNVFIAVNTRIVLSVIAQYVLIAAKNTAQRMKRIGRPQWRFSYI